MTQMNQQNIPRSTVPRDLRLRRRLKVVALALAAASIAAAAHADQDTPVPPVPERASEVLLPGQTVTLPIVMVREFPFIESSIAGVAGKLMLDTGMLEAFSVNDHRVPVSGGRSIGTGFFGSGQTYDLRLIPEVRDVHIGHLIYPSVTEVSTQDARMLEDRITPDFIGWLGYKAFENHVLKLDYKNLEATFFEEGGNDYLADERVIAELPFEVRRRENIPVMAGRIGDLAVITVWDTGLHGMLFTSEAGKARLLEEGRLTPSQTKPETFDLHGLQVDGRAMPVLSAIHVSTDPSPASAAMGISERDQLWIGYSLLSQYKTAWDYQRRRIYLLER